MRPIGFGLLSVPLALLPLLPLAPPDVQADGRGNGEAPSSGLATLHARDDLASSFDFRGGRPGGRVEQGEIRLDGAQIAFDVLAPDRISFGFVEDERVDVLDLGAFRIPPQARARDRAVEFPLALIHTLFFDGVRFGFVGPGGDRHALDEADRILGGLPPERIRHVDPVVGHTYVVRVHRKGLGAGDELFAFEVVGLVPEQTLTIRWKRLGGR
jgi:hypothetical protein